MDKRVGSRLLPVVAVVVISSLLFPMGVSAQGKADIRATKHNFSSTVQANSYSKGTQLQEGLSTTSTGAAAGRVIYSSTETQVCVFCHTPHGASTTDGGGNVLKAPLWNRTVPNPSTYAGYRSTSMDATNFDVLSSTSTAGQPEGSSKLCLSCHDGAIALSSVNVNAGQANVTLAQGTGNLGTIPEGGDSSSPFYNKLSGNTRNLGKDLTNDHPISVTFNNTLATNDGELRPVSNDSNQKWPATGTTVVGKRTSGIRPLAPLEPTGSSGEGQVQCASCHDPHVAPSTTNPENNAKFLRLNRFQTSASPSEDSMTSAFNASNDIICLSCHQKEGWADSAHADDTTSATYTDWGASDRGFPIQPTGYPNGIPVWRVACLNCHDTHAVSGTRRLLREGVTGNLLSGKTIRQGTAVSNYVFDKSALENTCFQCHAKVAANANKVVIQQGLTSDNLASQIPDVWTDFMTASNRRMPITKPAGTVEGHTIKSDTFGTAGVAMKAKDLSEPRANLGLNDNYATSIVDPPNRHAECTDCHNPHRVRRTKKFYQTPSGAAGGYGAAAHDHDNMATHNNVISGALRGGWGVEPKYTATNSTLLGEYVTSGLISALAGTEFGTVPSDFDVKYGNPPSSVAADPVDASPSYVTREYQICLKCHSNFAYSDTANFPDTHSSANRPNLGCTTGCTPKNTMGTNTTTYASYGLSRYTNQAMEFYAPDAHVGETNTMSRSGAHNRYENTNNYNHRSWHPVMKRTGRHSSKTGVWDAPWNKSGALSNQTMYCSDCHGNNVSGADTVKPDTGKPWGPHGSANNFVLKSKWETGTPLSRIDGGFVSDQSLCMKCHNQPNSASGFMHDTHATRVEGGLHCNHCHVAVPHGWKNKSLLVNLNDVGPEVMCRAGIDPAITSPACTAGKPIPPGTRITSNDPYTNPPYYMNAFLKVIKFSASGSWGFSSCGNTGTTPTGESDWMKPTCEKTQ